MGKEGRICVCGHFAFGENKLNGQTVKAKIVSEGLAEALGADALTYVDTGGGLRGVMLLPFRLARAAVRSSHIIIMPAHKGLRVVTLLLALLRVVGKFRVHYLVIGGWLPAYIQDKPWLRWSLHHGVDIIYPETSTMCRALRSAGFTRLEQMPNFKKLRIADGEGQSVSGDGVVHLCTFSRVMRNKGMEDAIRAVSYVNDALGRTACDLTIYGPIWPAETDWFEALQTSFPPYVRYGGSVPFDQSVEVLSGYQALLFPTRFYTEGVPGTIIDAYAAGVPVVASQWESSADVVEDGVTGWVYPFGNVEALCQLVLNLVSSPQCIASMRPACLRRATDFLPESVLPILLKNLGS